MSEFSQKIVASFQSDCFPNSEVDKFFCLDLMMKDFDEIHEKFP